MGRSWKRKEGQSERQERGSDIDVVGRMTTGVDLGPCADLETVLAPHSEGKLLTEWEERGLQSSS